MTDPQPTKQALVEAVRANHAHRTKAEADELVLVAAMCDAWSVVNEPAWDSQAAVPPPVLFGEQLIAIGAQGTPEVAEFLMLELGCALEVSPDSARLLIADVLNLRHRLPIIWEHSVTGEVRVWAARKIAQLTMWLDVTLCRRVDSQLGPRIAGMTPGAAIREAERLVALLDTTAEEERQRALDARRVDIEPSHIPGVAEVHGRLDAAAAAHLDATLDRGADALAAGGVEGTHENLRADALGLLAHPERAHLIIDEGLPFDDGSRAESHDSAQGDPEPSRRAWGVHYSADEADRRGVGARTSHDGRCRHGAELIIRAKASELNAGGGAGLEKFGPITRQHLAEILAGCDHVTVRPVIDLSEPLTVASYRPSPQLRWLVAERDQREVFPFSNRSSRSRLIDLDHTLPHGTGGETSSLNLGSLSRRAHRARTHGGYQVEQPEPGLFHWRTPMGQELWTNRHGTWRLRPPKIFDHDPARTTETVLSTVLRALAAAEPPEDPAAADPPRRSDPPDEVDCPCAQPPLLDEPPPF